MDPTISVHSTAGGIYEFEGFQLNPSARTLTDGVEDLRIGGRGFDLLVALVERAGRVVSKSDLVAIVWGSTVVDDNNLRVHVSMLRKLLTRKGDQRSLIESIAGNGYSFVAPVRYIESTHAETLDSKSLVPFDEFSPPPKLARIFGRDNTIDAASTVLKERRLVSLVGTGGVGKTTVALAIAQRVAGELVLKTRFVDVASITDARLIPAALATVTGAVIHPEKTFAALGESLKDARFLLLLDSCERFVDDICNLVENVLSRAPDILILTTSREPLRARGEQVHRLEPLKTPAAYDELSASAARQFSAIELFEERAKARFDGFEMRDGDVNAVVELCRKLDGLPLAIELAAARVEALGLHGLVSELDDRFQVLTVGRRTALPRHQTLRATLDWSYEYLPGHEQSVLRQLSIFRRNFSLEGAGRVVADVANNRVDFVQILSDLVEKSLVVVDHDEALTRFRLLDSTRAYALEKLIASGEYRQVARRHATYWRNELSSKSTSLCVTKSGSRDIRFISLLDDVRSALDWAFSSDGDVDIGVQLATNAAGVWSELSLMPEYKERIYAAITSLSHGDDSSDEIVGRLSVIVGHAEVNESTPDASAFQTALVAGERFGNIDLQLDALHGLCVSAILRGSFRLAVPFAEKIRQLANSSETAAVLYERVSALIAFQLGDPVRALAHADCALYKASSEIDGAAARPTLKSDLVSAVLAVKARILWCLGFPDQAMVAADRAVSRAEEIGHLLSLGYALSMGGCQVASWIGNDAKLERYLSMLRAQDNASNVLRWDSWVRCFHIAACARAGDTAAVQTGLTWPAPLSPGAQELLATQNVFIVTSDVLRRADADELGWASAEVYREHGEALLRVDREHAEQTAEQLFSKAIHIARRQRALSWELRASMSMARLKMRAKEPKVARAMLTDVFGRFSEGFDSRDLKETRDLLHVLSSEID